MFGATMVLPRRPSDRRGNVSRVVTGARNSVIARSETSPWLPRRKGTQRLRNPNTVNVLRLSPPDEWLRGASVHISRARTPSVHQAPSVEGPSCSSMGPVEHAITKRLLNFGYAEYALDISARCARETGSAHAPSTRTPDRISVNSTSGSDLHRLLTSCLVARLSKLRNRRRRQEEPKASGTSR